MRTFFRKTGEKAMFTGFGIETDGDSDFRSSIFMMYYIVKTQDFEEKTWIGYFHNHGYYLFK